MRILGIGIDLADISRLERAATRTPGVLERIFTEQELQYCLSKRHPYEHLAGRFAAKEACIKALGRSVPWRSMEVRRSERGKPVLHVDTQYLPDPAAHVLVTFTHERTMAAASVVITVPDA